MKLLIAATTAILIISCNTRGKNTVRNAVSEVKVEEIKKPAFDNLVNNEADNTDTTASPQQPQKQNQLPKNEADTKIDWDKKIVKTASLNAEIKNYDSFYVALREKVRNFGGYVAQEQQSQSDYKIENTITIRVPVDQFDNAVTSMMKGTDKIIERKISSQDVTAEMVDIRSRVEAKKQVRARYLDFLRQARNMSEMLSVQAEINAVQEEIESAAGRINYLSHSSVFSTINFTFYQVLNIAAKETAAPSFFTQIKTSFKSGWKWIGDIVV